MTEIYLLVHIDARMADYIRTRPYSATRYHFDRVASDASLPHADIELRLEPMVRFYQSRLPKYLPPTNKSL